MRMITERTYATVKIRTSKKESTENVTSLPLCRSPSFVSNMVHLSTIEILCIFYYYRSHTIRIRTSTQRDIRVSTKTLIHPFFLAVLLRCKDLQKGVLHRKADFTHPQLHPLDCSTMPAKKPIVPAFVVPFYFLSLAHL